LDGFIAYFRFESIWRDDAALEQFLAHPGTYPAAQDRVLAQGQVDVQDRVGRGWESHYRLHLADVSLNYKAKPPQFIAGALLVIDKNKWFWFSPGASA